MRHTKKGIHTVAKKTLLVKTDGLLKVTWTLMWVILVLARVDRNKINGKLNTYVLELSPQLRVEQLFTPLEKLV